MRAFATEFFQWADVLDVPEEESFLVLEFLGRAEALPQAEREAVRAVVDSIGPMEAARMVECSEGAYLHWLVTQRAKEILPSVRASLRERELAEMPYAEYLRTPEWCERAAAARTRFGHRCAVCNTDGDLEVHHRTYERRGREQPEDLIPLCPGCHAFFHEWRDIAAIPVEPL